MNIAHTVIASIMGLLVSVSMCVCGNAFLFNPLEEEYSFCSHQHEEQQEHNPEDDGHDCDLTHHDKVEYLSENSDFSYPKPPEQVINLGFLVPGDIITDLFAIGGDRLRSPPPDRFAQASRSITYCIYRL